MNEFNQLDAQSETSRLAQVRAEENGPDDGWQPDDAPSFWAEEHAQELADKSRLFALSPAFKAAWLRGE